MEYYHVRITQHSSPAHDETRLDMGFAELEARFLAPYREGSAIVINGKSIPASDISRVRITKSSQNSDSLRGIVRAERRQSSVVVVGLSEDWEVADKGEDVTDELITSPPGEQPALSSARNQELRPTVDSREVFVVHGRNLAARDALFEFLRSIDLHPLEWAEAVSVTGRPSPYIGEILDAAFSRAHAVVVLFTPDDDACLREEFRVPGDPPHETELSGQARPNVIFEAGMAMSRSEDRTILVEIGVLRPFSDLAGRHAVRLNNSSQRRQEFAQRLGAAGCPVHLTGTDWHTAGDFEAALASTISKEPETPNVSEEETAIADNTELSEDAREILTEATKDYNRSITKFDTMGGLTYSTNNRTFGDMGVPRSEARWEGAVYELVKLGLLNVEPGGRGNLFRVTREGFAAIDALETPELGRNRAP